jgi:hypothetical protein
MLITIAAADFAEYRDISRVPTEARLRANRQFKASDGTVILAGGDANPDAYQRFDITMQGAMLRVESGEAYSTTDSDQPDATYTLDAFDADGTFLFNLLSRIRISDENDPTTWDTITEFSKGVVQRTPATYLDSNAILRLFNNIVNGAAVASAVQRGVLKLDVAAADLTNPIAVGLNSPIVSSIADKAPKDDPVFTGRVRKSTSTPITPGATPTIDASLGDVFTLTPGEDENISIVNQAAGQEITLIILTSGSTSRTITFGTGFKPSGTLATGVVSGKYFLVKFFSDGTNAYELKRTAAL